MAWLSGYDYRKSITLSRASGTVTNYQMKLLVSEGDNRYSYHDIQINEHKNNYGANDTDNVILSLGVGGTFDDERINQPCVIEKDGTVYLFYSGYDGLVWKIGVATANTSGFTGKGFTKSGNNPILSVGGGGAWDEKGVQDPFVIYDSDAGIWKMWFRGISAAGVHAIGYATSNNPDSGWNKDGGNPRLSPAGWEGNYLLTHSVLRENSTTYKMLYSGGEPTTASDIGLATSSDGVSWTKYGSNPVFTNTGAGWEALSVFSPRSIQKVGGEYRILYTGKPNDATKYSKMGYAYSSDLISWTRGTVNPVIIPSKTWEGLETENPNILRLGETEYIYYDCWYGTPQTIGGAIIQRPVLNGHIQSDFDDLRFTSSDGETLLDYWIESIVGTTPNQIATVWVEFNSVGTGATTFYMYYGKADAVAYSNGNNTFQFFDDFSGDLSKWSGDTGDAAISGGICTVTGDANGTAIYSASKANDIALRARANLLDGNYSFVLLSENPIVDDYVGLYHDTGAGATHTRHRTQKGANGTDISYTTLGFGSYQIYEITRFITGTDIARTYTGGIQNGAGSTTNVPIVDLAACLRAYNVGITVLCDWILIRQYVETEPAWGAWGDEVLGGSASLSPSSSPSVSVSSSPSVSSSISFSYSPSVSPSGSPSTSPSGSPSLSPSASISPSQSTSMSPSTSLSNSPSGSPSTSLSSSPSLSPSASLSPSISPSVSFSISPSGSPSVSQSMSPSVSPSVSPSGSPSTSYSISPSTSPSIPPFSLVDDIVLRWEEVIASFSPSPSVSPSMSPSPSPSMGPDIESLNFRYDFVGDNPQRFPAGDKYNYERFACPNIT